MPQWIFIGGEKEKESINIISEDVIAKIEFNYKIKHFKWHNKGNYLVSIAEKASSSIHVFLN